jgi:hypothetical protein
MTAPTDSPDAPAPQQMQVPITDPGNPFIGEYPAMLSAQPVPTPGGQRLAVTMRVGSGTLTALLAKDDAERWRDVLSQETARMNGLILPGGAL